LSIILGQFAGLGLALAAELTNQTIRSGEDGARILGTEFLGATPIFRHQSPLSSASLPSSSPQGEHVIRSHDRVLDQVLDFEGSTLWHTLRKVRIAADMGNGTHRMRLIGVTSALSRGGTTAVSANLARLMARAGNRVLIIDADPYGPDLSAILAPDAQVGILDLQQASSISDAVWTDEKTGMHFLPLVSRCGPYADSETLWSEATIALIVAAATMYDYVIFDLPPLGPVVDVRAASHILDSILLVVEHGKVTPDHIHKALSSAGIPQSKLLGFILSKVSRRSLRRLGYEQDFPRSDRGARGQAGYKANSPKQLKISLAGDDKTTTIGTLASSNRINPIVHSADVCSNSEQETLLRASGRR
jgi:succinoglycan biosynthesis transport protein ExoP